VRTRDATDPSGGSRPEAASYGRSAPAPAHGAPDVFSYYDRIYIAEISTNKELMKKWKDNEVIDLRTE
jgi:hypothetical protein